MIEISIHIYFYAHNRKRILFHFYNQEMLIFTFLHIVLTNVNLGRFSLTKWMFATIDPIYKHIRPSQIHRNM